MPLKIVRNDITKMPVDAIVNAANCSLLGGGGVDGCIHRAAGRGLLEECRTLGGCETGNAKITGAYELPCKYVIHTVGPVWQGGGNGEKELLTSCYRTSLTLAKEHHCETVAFPLISAGAYGYPKAEALRVAVDSISKFLSENNVPEYDMTVYIVIFDKSAYQIGETLFSDIAAYIDDVYVDEHTDYLRESCRFEAARPEPGVSFPEDKPTKTFAVRSNRAEKANVMPRIQKISAPKRSDKAYPPEVQEYNAVFAEAPAAFTEGDLNQVLAKLDESFSEMLLRKIDEKGMTDAECYKKANIDRKLFSKIRNDIHYRPSKPTVIAFAVSLELTLAETKELLQKAGFALSHSSKFDVIIEYFISKKNYNIFEINEALFAFDQNLLGA